MQNTNYYRILGLELGASPEEIRAAFKKLALKYHPDLNPGNPEAEDQFKIISLAHEVLSDPEKKRIYDLKLTGYFDFVHLKTAQQQTEQYRRKYGNSSRKRFSQQDLDDMMLGQYEKAMKAFPIRWRYLVSFILISLGMQLAIYNIERVDSTRFVGLMLFGYLLFVLGSYLLYKSVFVYRRALYLKKLIRNYSDSMLIFLFAVLLFTGAISSILFSDLRADYHLKNYGTYTTGKYVSYNESYLVFSYVTPGGEMEKKVKIGPENEPVPGQSILVIYSSRDPYIARIYKYIP